MKTIILDLDGTVYNTDHRQHLAQAGLWDEFHSMMTEDKINPDVMWFVKLMQKLDLQGIEQVHILVVTGRPEKYRNMTESMLRCNGLLVDQVLMRPDNDYTHDSDLKIRLIEEYFGSKEAALHSIILCLEDRDKVVEGFRNYGLNCWQVRQGAF